MRKAIVLFLFSIPVSRSFAQLTITPELGYNKTDFFTTAPSNQIVTTPLNGFQAGALITRKWKLFFLQSGLEFAQKGSYQGRGFQAPYGSNTNIKLSYLQAPLNVGAHIKIYKGLQAIASAGVYLAYGLSGTEKGTSQDINGSSTIDRQITFSSSVTTADNTKTFIKPFDSGYNFSAGLSYANVELKTVYSKSSGTVSPIGSSNYRNEVWNFSVGYAFVIK